MRLSVPLRLYVIAITWLLVVNWTYCPMWAQETTDNPFTTAYRNRYGKLPKSPTMGDQMFANWVHLKTGQVSQRWNSFASNLKDWDNQQENYRQQLREMLGLDPLPERTDLKATVTGTVSHPEFTVENLHFQSRPGLYCTANVYIPKKHNAKSPAVLYLCGHGAVKENGVSFGNKVHYQHHGAWFARNGYVCMVLDSVQLGEIEGKHHGTHHLDMWWWNSRGFSAAGPEAWNCIRALDYLQSRPDVDPDKLAVTGRSGGGAYSWWIAALDTRIKAACPVAGITDLQNHAVDGCVEGHCDCMFMVNSYQWDYGMVAALVAPRPLLICNTDKDNIFPIDGVMRLHAQVRNFYDFYKAPEKLGVAITEGGHVDTQELQVPVMRWFNKWLKNDESPITNAAERFFKPQQLKVFDKIPEDEITSRCYESFTTLANKEPVSTDSTLNLLRSKTFAAWPTDESESSYAPKQLAQKTKNGIELTVFKLESELGINLRTYLLSPVEGSVNKVNVLVLDNPTFQDCMQKLVDDGWDVLEDESKLLSKNAARATLDQFDHWMKHRSSSNEALLLVAPRGVGITALGGDAKYQTHLRRRLMLLGSTLASSQVWDVIQSTKFISSQLRYKAAKLDLAAGESMTEVACFAALFGPKLNSISLSIPPRDDLRAADFLNWSRVVTAEQLLALVSAKTKVDVKK